jgi:hypothetical protein
MFVCFHLWHINLVVHLSNTHENVCMFLPLKLRYKSKPTGFHHENAEHLSSTTHEFRTGKRILLFNRNLTSTTKLRGAKNQVIDH